jgi:hypothetical protein
MKPKDMTKEFPHGTRARYVGMKCRCRKCTFANRAYVRQRTKEKYLEAKDLPQPWKKGRILLGRASDGAKVWVTMRLHCVGPGGKGCGKKIRKHKRPRLCDECLKKVSFKGLVTATRARKHLKALSAKGIGRRAVSAASDVADTVLSQIISGRKKHIRAETSRRILDVDESCMADASLVDAGPTWGQIKDLMEKAKMPKAEIAGRLGNKVPALQLRKTKVRLSTANAVGKLHRQVFAELETDPGMPLRKATAIIRRILAEEGMTPRQLANYLGWPNLKMRTYKGCVSTTVWDELQNAFAYFCGGEKEKKPEIICTRCGLSHGAVLRKRRLRLALPLTSAQARDRWPCIYPRNSAGDQKLSRDFDLIGASIIEGVLRDPDAVWGIIPEDVPPQASQKAGDERTEDACRVEREGQEHPGDRGDDAGAGGGGEHPDDLPRQRAGAPQPGAEAGGGGQGEVQQALGAGGQGVADAPQEAGPRPVAASP